WVVAGAGKAKIIVARFNIAIEQDLFGTAIARGAHNLRVLLALKHARIIGEGAIGGGHAAIVFLDAAADFLENPVLQIGSRLAEFGVVISVFGFEIGADFGVQRLGLLHHFLPIVGAEPRIGIVTTNIVMRVGMLDALGDGRIG